MVNAIGTAEESVPDELIRIRTEHREKIEKATAPIHSEYIRELERLKENLTRTGDLDGALLVDRELARALALGKWDWSNAGKKLTLWIRPDGSFSSSENDKIGTWAIADRKLRFWDATLSYSDGRWSGTRNHDGSQASMERK